MLFLRSKSQRADWGLGKRNAEIFENISSIGSSMANNQPITRLDT
jgi:hypothetical protein